MSTVFDTMLKLTLEEAPLNRWHLDGPDMIISSVGITGSVKGSVCLHLTLETARQLTAGFLGITRSADLKSEDIYDAIGELNNMVTGNLKSNFYELDLPCDVALPTLILGQKLNVEARNDTRREDFVYQSKAGLIRVELFYRIA